MKKNCTSDSVFHPWPKWQFFDFFSDKNSKVKYVVKIRLLRVFNNFDRAWYLWLNLKEKTCIWKKIALQIQFCTRGQNGNFRWFFSDKNSKVKYVVKIRLLRLFNNFERAWYPWLNPNEKRVFEKTLDIRFSFAPVAKMAIFWLFLQTKTQRFSTS